MATDTDGMVLVSACLAGRSCAYDGCDRAADPVMELVAAGRAVLVCPEEDGGLPTPRPAAEIVGGTGADVLDGRARVRTRDGVDVTDEYLAGARLAVDKAISSGCDMAILKARSPACSCVGVYDGSFTRTLFGGDGVAAAALRRAGVRVVSDEDD